MPQHLGPEKRGRKREALRIAAADLAAQVTPTKGEASQSITVEVAPAIAAVRKTKTEAGSKALPKQTVTFDIPKGAVAVPFALTNGKSKDTVRETLTHGASDAGLKVSVNAEAWTLDDGRVGPDGTGIVRVFYLDSPKEKAEK